LLVPSFPPTLVLQAQAKASSDVLPVDSPAAVLSTLALFLQEDGVLTINRGHILPYLGHLLLGQALALALLLASCLLVLALRAQAKTSSDVLLMDSTAAVPSMRALFLPGDGVLTINRGHILPYLGHLLLGQILAPALLPASYLLVLALQGLARTSSDAHQLDSMAVAPLTHALFLPGNGVPTINRGRTHLYLEGLLLPHVLIPSLLHQLLDPALQALEAFSDVLPMGLRDVVLWMLAIFHQMDGAQITTLGPTLPSLKHHPAQHRQVQHRQVQHHQLL
jgi:hypothetical protein